MSTSGDAAGAPTSPAEAVLTDRQIFDLTGDAIFIHREDGKILDVNARMLELYGWDRAAALGLTLDQLGTMEPGYTADEA